MSSGEDALPRTLTILYATETGTAQDIADRIAAQCRRIQLTARVHSMEDYSPVSNTHILTAVATTGSGKEPRAMTSLWNLLLRSDLPEDLFEDLHFAVFGLGDTAYEKFCWPAKLLSRRLVSLGAVEICARGEGDEQHHLGIDGAFEPWISQLLEKLLLLCPLPPGTSISPAGDLPPPRVEITNLDFTGMDSFREPIEINTRYHKARMTCNSRITADDWYQDVRHFEFEFSENISYEPGDVAIIHPEASKTDVESFLATIGYAEYADQCIVIAHTRADQSLPSHLPNATSLRGIFTRYLDISAVPRRSFFALLRHFVTDELEKEKLDEFLSEEGADDLYEYCQRPRRMIREVMEEFRSARIPVNYIFDLFPPLRPRQFSIASSGKCHPRHIHLCVAVVQYRTMLKIPRRGICTDFLTRLSPGSRLLIGIQKGLFTLSQSNESPIICVGPGTGVAPMRAIIEERRHTGHKDNTLYFGCRSAAKDQHYASEWASYAADGSLTYRAAYSRDGPEGVPRTYVQDIIREDALRVWELLGPKGGSLYISGSSNKMPTGVKAAIQYAAQTGGGKSEEEAQEFVALLEREGRLIEECWS
ncbi:uncharacterized protein FIBRA_01840 [Fibroporia radiculosa]|uniref:NADPH-dependent diflavin oxidoreductase 1 n=1 Tax=Fibroporia radiculosa TaxID=599839 RepID=J4I8Q4_9APHY|nr:uncharacterized protein FIBRA_01840 [Fibroporia radiculosa]CCL99816.1 predicted protein [Fibroporia radiculosa]